MGQHCKIKALIYPCYEQRIVMQTEECLSADELRTQGVGMDLSICYMRTVLIQKSPMKNGSFPLSEHGSEAVK